MSTFASLFKAILKTTIRSIPICRLFGYSSHSRLVYAAFFCWWLFFHPISFSIFHFKKKNRQQTGSESTHLKSCDSVGNRLRLFLFQPSVIMLCVCVCWSLDTGHVVAISCLTVALFCVTWLAYRNILSLPPPQTIF
jgi:hypothetical protein